MFSSNKKSILVIDDDQTLTTKINTVFRALNYSVTIANNFLDAEKLISSISEENNYDVCIIDGNMEGEDTFIDVIAALFSSKSRNPELEFPSWLIISQVDLEDTKIDILYDDLGKKKISNYTIHEQWQFLKKEKHNRLIDYGETIKSIIQRVKVLSNDFWKKFSYSKNTIRVAHVSDLHFGSHHIAVSENVRPKPSTLANHFYSFIEDIIPPDFLVISGDISSTSKEEEYLEFKNKFYDKSYKFLSKIKAYNKSDRVLVVPGNHDVDWIIDTETHTIQESKNIQTFRQKFYFEWDINTSLGRKDEDEHIFCFSGAQRQDANLPRCCIYYYEEKNILFLALNSAYYSGEVTDEIKESLIEITDKYTRRNIEKRMRVEYGCFDEDYPDYVKNTLRDFRSKYPEIYKKCVKLGVIHHNIRKIAETEETKEAHRLVRVLDKNGFSMILHGHTHAPTVYSDFNSRILEVGVSTLSAGYTLGPRCFYMINIIPNTETGEIEAACIERYESDDLGRYFKERPKLEYIREI